MGLPPKPRVYFLCPHKENEDRFEGSKPFYKQQVSLVMPDLIRHLSNFSIVSIFNRSRIKCGMTGYGMG